MRLTKRRLWWEPTNRWLFWPWLVLALLWVIYGFYPVWDEIVIEGYVLRAIVFEMLLVGPLIALYGLLLLNLGLSRVLKRSVDG